MKKLLVTAFLMAAFAAPVIKPKPPVPPSPYPGAKKPPVPCVIQPRPCLPIVIGK